MKASGKIIGRLIVGCVFACCLSRFTSQTFAIEGLQVSVQSTNAVLSWPSDPSETYIVQSRNTLNAAESWATLTDYYPADSSTNITFFVDPNPVQFGSSGSGGSGGGSGGIPSPGSGGSGGSGSGVTNGAPGTGFYRVVRDGAHLFGITNDMVLSGIVHLPVELANDGGTVSTMSLTENDSPVGNSTQTAPLVSPGALIVDTTQMANGVHQVSASARWEDTNGGLWEADSPPLSVTVSNEISFENWMPSFGETGNTFLFRATSAHADTDWIVSVYNSNHTYLGYFSGHTYDGDISFYYDYSGTSLTNNRVFYFEIATEYVDPPTPPLYKVTDPWSGPGAWVIVAQHAWDGALYSDLLYAELTGFIGAALGVNWTVMPPPQGRDEYDNWLAYGLTFGANNPQGDTDWQNFRNALFDSRSRNLVYFGHGGPNGLGYNQTTTNRSITSAEIASRLHTIPAGQTNRHAFRFVFLDGCQTAKGNLPEAFGILHRENVDLNDYIAASMRPSAFAGWNAEKWIDLFDGYAINYQHVNFINYVQMEMLLYGNGIHDAIHNAATHWDVFFSFNWINQMEVYGFWDLHFGQYNN